MERGEHDAQVLELTAAVLGGNPDFATLFSYRRRTLTALMEAYGRRGGGDG